MLYIVDTISEQISNVLNQDPVRPNIPHCNRIGTNKNIFISKDSEENILAITCVCYQTNIPENEDQLFVSNTFPDTVVFYTIWSYKQGEGRNLIFDSVDYIKKNKPNIKRFVTLSPKTEMAKKFHLKNGATVFKENANSVNYEYIL